MDMNAKIPVPETTTRKILNGKLKKREVLDSDEYCMNTHQNRKYVISKINSFISSTLKKSKKRKQMYDGYVKATLAKVWKIFDCPCGQRLFSPMKERGL